MSGLTPDQFKRLPTDGDQFEALVCQLLEAMGYRILEKPAIGTEGGRDILVERILKDAMVERREKVVIQCKHHAHSGKAVGDSAVGVWENVMKRYKARGYLLVTDARVTENLSRSFHAFSSDEANTPKWANFWDVDELILYLNQHSTIRDSFFPPQALARTPLEQLAEEVRVWLTAIKYEVSEPTTVGKKTLDMVATLEQGTIKQQILVRCVGGEISLTNVEELNESLNIKMPQGWLVSDRRISSRAKKRAHELGSIQVFNLSSLLQQMIWGPYFEQLRELVDSEKIATRYVDIGCFKIDTDDTGNETARERYESLDAYIDDWLGERGKMHISLLADFGSGKTWFCRHYAYLQLQRFLRNPSRERFPLLITLRSFAKAMTAKQLINYSLLEHYKLPFLGSAYEVVQEMNRRGKVLLILDGFDEMARKVDYQTVVDNFWQLANLVEDQGKVILTSRKEYFRQAKESEKVLGGEEYGRDTLVLEPPKFEVMYLESFTNEQIRTVIIQRYGQERGQHTADTILKTPTLAEMARKPLMVELLLAALDEVAADVLKHQAQVFLYATNRLLLRNIKAEKTFTSTADKLYFLCELAWEMIRKNDLRIHYTLVPERIGSYFGDRIKDQHELDTWDYDLRSQTLLHRDSAGYYEFAHKSLAEYFVALKFALELNCISREFLETYCEMDGKPCNNFIGEKDFVHLIDSFGALPAGTIDTVFTLLSTMLSDDANKKLWTLIHETRGKSIEQVGYVGTNSFSVLRMRGEKFVAKNMSGVVLPSLNLIGTSLAKTDLTKTVLSHSQLIDVDLSKSQCIETNFSNAWLNSVNIKHTKFERAIFSQARVDYRRSLLGVAYHPSDNVIATDGTRSALALWDSNTGEELLSFTDHDWSHQCIQFSPQGNLVASGGMTGRLVVSDCINGKTVWRTKAHADAIRWLHFSANGCLLASVGEDLRLTIWNTFSWKKVTQVELSAPMSCVAFSPDIEYIAAGTRNGEVRVWDLSTMEELWSFVVCNGRVDFVSFSPDSKKLIAGGDRSGTSQAVRRRRSRVRTGDFTVKVWDIGDKRQTLEINTESGGGWNRGTISPSEPLVAIRSERNSIAIWNYLTGEELRELKGHDDTVFCMVFNSDGSYLASSSRDGTVRTWNMTTGESQLCIVFDLICTGSVFKDCIGLPAESIYALRIRGAAVEEE